MDDLPPTITVLYPSDVTLYTFEYTGEINITLNEVGGNCSINDTNWKFNATLSNTTFFSFENNTLPPQQITKLNISCWDQYLNNNSVAYTFAVDYTAPVFDEYPNNITVEFATEIFSVDFNATENEIAINNWFTNDSSNYSIGLNDGILTNDLQTISVGIHFVNVSVKDTHGNTNSTTFQINVNDTTAPTFTFIIPLSSISFGESFSVDYNATDASNLSMYFINDTTNFIINETNGTIWDAIALSSGTYHINVSVNDTWGNVRSTTYALTVGAAPASPSESTGGTGGTSAGWVTLNETEEGAKETIGEITMCTQNTNILDRLRDTCKSQNGICDDGEYFPLDKECGVTYSNFRKLEFFKSMWFLKYILLATFILLLRRNNKAPLMVLFVITLLALNGAFGVGQVNNTPINYLNNTELLNDTSITSNTLVDFMSSNRLFVEVLVIIILFWVMFKTTFRKPSK